MLCAAIVAGATVAGAVAPGDRADARFPFVGASYTGEPGTPWDGHGVVSCVAVATHWVLASGHGRVGKIISFEADASRAPVHPIRVDTANIREIPGTDLVLVHTIDAMSNTCDISSFGPRCGFEVNQVPGINGETSLQFRKRTTTPDSLVWVGYGPSGEDASDGDGYNILWQTKGQRHAVAGRADCTGILTGAKGNSYGVWGTFLLRSGDPIVNGGDSGGAVLLKRGKKYLLVGIISYRLGSGNEFAGSGGVKVMSMAADVTTYADAIRDVIGHSDR